MHAASGPVNANDAHHIAHAAPRLYGMTRVLKSALGRSAACLTCIMATAAYPAWAEVENAKEILVTADRIAQSAAAANAARRASPAPLTVIDQVQLTQFGELALGDALRRMPGVTFDGGNRARELRLRGIGDEYAQVLINGLPFIDGNSRRSAQLDRIPSALIARAEILRAPLARYDGQGAAGTLNLILPTRDFASRARFGLSVGDVAQQGFVGDANASLAGQAGAVGGSLLASLQRNRRAESKDTLIFRGDGSANGGELQLNQRAYRQANVVPSFGIDLGTSTKAFVEGLWLWTEEKRVDDRTELLADQRSVRRREVEDRLRVRENGLVRSSIEQAIGGGLLSVMLDWQASREDTERDSKRFTAAGVQDRSRQRTERIRLQRLAPAIALALPLDGHDVRLGADASRLTRKERNTDIQNGVSVPPNLARIYEIEEKRANLFVEDVWQVSEQLRLAGGVRWEWSRTQTEDALGTRGEIENNYLLPHAHLTYQLAPQVDLRAGVSRTLRRPNLRELSPFVSANAGTVVNPDIGGNPRTLPEKIWGLDGGVDFFFAERAGLLAASAFWRRFEDKIEFIAADEGGRIVSRPQNSGKGRLWGLEGEARLPLVGVGLPWATLWGNATLVRTRLTSADAVDGTTRRFLDQPDAVLNGGVDVFIKPLRTTFGAGINWNSGFDQKRRLANGTIRRDETGSIARLDVSARSQITERISLTVSASNLTARTERSLVEISSATGQLQSSTRITEPTYRSLFARIGVTL